MSGRTWLACLVAAIALVAIPWTLWPFAIFAVAVAVAMVQTVRVRSLRKRLATTTSSLATTITALADRVDELAHADALVTRLAQENARLSGDVLAAQLLASDAREELAAAPAPVIPLPVVREASPYDWPVADGHFPVHTEVNDDEIEALMRATEEN